MRILYHLALDAGCRKIRLLLAEKELSFELKTENTWERREGFLRLNPAGQVPVLIEADGTIIPDHRVVVEYLEEAYTQSNFLGEAVSERAEARRLTNWFDEKFGQEVTNNLVSEKIFKRFLKLGEPNSAVVRAGHSNIHYHLEYIAWLTDRRRWLAGERFSLADITAAAHISTVDYLGDVPWSKHPTAKDWYARVKSRPSMRDLLADYLPGAAPPKHYADLDF
ncbi:MAG: glutathione S-transferase family protein [Rhodospirillales bacterium]